jgi:Flp pilus assembly protein CpaB
VENITSSKLFRTRQGTLVLGVVAAVLAAIVLIVYLREYRNSVTKGEVLQVLVAKSLIPKNTSGNTIASTGLYKLETLAKNDVQAGAFVSPGSLNGTVALQQINPGQQLTSSDFGTPSNPLVPQLSRGQRAVVIPLDSPSEVGGQITAGDHVDVWVLATRGATPVAHEMLQNMLVMNGGTTGGGNVTLNATPQQAGELIYASNNAKIWLVLRPTRGSVIRPPSVTLNNLVGG